MRIIDADALLKALKANCDTLCNDKNTNWCEHCCPKNDFEDLIDNAPTIEREPFATVTFDKDELNRIVNERVIEPIKNGELVIKEERPQGEWIEHYDNSDGFTWLTCSRCMCKAYEDDYNFCPNCGADMRKEAENDHP